MEPTPSELDSLKTVIGFSQSLSQWAALLIGGAVVALLASSNWRPRKWWIRLIYLMFIPALIYLFASVHYGVAAQQNCLGLMLFVNPDSSGAKHELNHNVGHQLSTMQTGFIWLGVWFLAFLIWWVFDNRIDPEKRG